jgi:hypothetical protein
MHLSRLRAFAAAVVAVSLLSACTSNPNATAPAQSPTLPRASETATISPTTSPAPSKNNTVRPDLATLKTAAQAYFAAHNQAVRARDTIAFRRTFTPRCKLCAAEAAHLDKYTALGQVLNGGDYHMTGGKLLKAVPGGGILFFSATQEPSTLVDRAGKTIKTFKDSNVPGVYFEFSLIKSKWVVAGGIVG